jgi:hypothetical protein
MVAIFGQADGRISMRDDPIVAEVRKIRQKIAAKFKYDVRAIAEDARKRQRKSGHPIVSPRRRTKTN